MTPKTLEIADAIAKELTERQYAAKRGYLPELARADAKDTHILITPRSDTPTPAGRSQTDHEHVLNVVVIRAVDPQNMTECDAVVATAAAIAELFDSGPLGEVEMAGAEFVRVAHDPLFVPEHLRTQNQLTSVLTLTYTFQP